MAIGNGSSDVSPDEKPNFGDNAYYNGFNADAEKGGVPGGARKMSRIDKPVTKSISGLMPDDDMTETSVSVGKQMELEAGNAIQYRTCSWYKV